MGKHVKKAVQAVTNVPKNITGAVTSLVKNPTKMENWANAALVGTTGGVVTLNGLEKSLGQGEKKAKLETGNLETKPDKALEEEMENARKRARSSNILAGATDAGGSQSSRKSLLGV